jgi:transposase
MSISEPMHVSKLEPAPFRRMEVFTGAGRRRSWTLEEKAKIVAESFGSEDSVCGVARRHGLTPQQLFTWRRQARQSATMGTETPAPLFVPAIVEASLGSGDERHRDGKRRRWSSGNSGTIELEVGGVTVRVGRGAPAKTIAAVIRALKAS